MPLLDIVSLLATQHLLTAFCCRDFGFSLSENLQNQMLLSDLWSMGTVTQHRKKKITQCQSFLGIFYEVSQFLQKAELLFHQLHSKRGQGEA